MLRTDGESAHFFPLSSPFSFFSPPARVQDYWGQNYEAGSVAFSSFPLFLFFSLLLSLPWDLNLTQSKEVTFFSPSFPLLFFLPLPNFLCCFRGGWSQRMGESPREISGYPLPPFPPLHPLFLPPFLPSELMSQIAGTRWHTLAFFSPFPLFLPCSTRRRGVAWYSGKHVLLFPLSQLFFLLRSRQEFKKIRCQWMRLPFPLLFKLFYLFLPPPNFQAQIQEGQIDGKSSFPTLFFPTSFLFPLPWRLV